MLLLSFFISVNEHGSPYGASAQWVCRIMLFLKILRKVICIQKMSFGIYSVSQPVSYLERIHLEVMAKSRCYRKSSNRHNYFQLKCLKCDLRWRLDLCLKQGSTAVLSTDILFWCLPPPLFMKFLFKQDFQVKYS